MFTPRENLYINTFLEKEGRGIWYRWFVDGCEVYVNRRGRYILEFGGQHQAIEFYQRIIAGENVGVSMKDGVIVVDIRDNKSRITINCGTNEELATKITKHLRKQWVMIRRQELKQQAIQQKISQQTKKQEIEDIGIKF